MTAWTPVAGVNSTYTRVDEATRQIIGDVRSVVIGTQASRVIGSGVSEMIIDIWTRVATP